MAYLILYVYLIGLYIRPQDWYGPMLGFPIDSAILAVLLMLMFLRRKQEALAVTPQTTLFLLWISAVILSCVVNLRFDQARVFGLKYLTWFLVYAGFIIFVDSYTKFRNIIIFILLLTLFLAVQGIDHKLSADGIGWAGQPLGWTDAATARAGGSGRIQWVGLWDGPNVFCILFVVAVPFLLQFALRPWSLPLRIFSWVSLATVFVAIFFTNSRGGFLALLAGLMLTFWNRFAGMKKVAVTIMALAIALAYAPSRMSSMDDEDRSTYHRVEMWYQSINMLKQDPVFGIGAGEFANYTGKLIAHNSFIQNMGETGLFGLFAWVLLMYATIQTLRRMRDAITDEKLKSLTSGLLVCVYCYMVMSLTLTTEFEILYVLVALSVALARVAKFDMALTRRDYGIASSVVFGGVASVFLFTRVYMG